MRVITGTARGRKLKTLDGNDVRPTTDKIKEAMFSAVQFELEGAVVLDLFAGSGQLGIEAISRGAQKCYFVDSAAASLNVVKENIKTVGFEKNSFVFQSDYNTFLANSKDKFDIVFLDPPYHKGLIEKVLNLLDGKLSFGAKVICEHEREAELPEAIGNLKIKKSYRYGNITVTIYENGGDAD